VVHFEERAHLTLQRLSWIIASDMMESFGRCQL